MKKTIENMFNQSAASYDEQYSKISAVKDSLHICMQAIFTDLPVDAHVLCIGAGTGQELMFLAETFPAWKFTVVEPASAMLSICRHKAEASGIASRCTFHEGYIETLSNTDLFDAATAILVSQFLTDRDDRCRFFSEIARRLRKNGLLVSADLAADMSGPDFRRQFEYWCSMLEILPEKAESLKDQWATNLAVVPTGEVEKIIVSGGFEKPILFYKTFFIHGWCARL